MRAVWCVGRVGGLAVALGVGCALVVGAGVATADDSESTSGPSSVSVDAGPKKPAAQKFRLTVPRPDVDADAREAQPPTAEPEAPRDRRASARPDPVKAVEAVSARFSRAAKEFAADVAKPITRTPEPRSVDTPAQWVLAAAARREFVSEKLTYAPDIGVTDGVITGDNDGTDADAPSGLPLTYHVVSRPNANGKVTLDKTTGDFSYLPYSATTNPDGTRKYATAEKFKVLVAETTPFDAALERIPVLGDLVAPVLLRLHQVPVVNVVLSPLIGRSDVFLVTVNPAAEATAYVNPIAFTTTVVSFDSTPISVNWFPKVGLVSGAEAPTLLNGPSLATAGYVDPTQETTVFGLVPGLQQTRVDYNVVTWDPRGEYASGGVLHLDSPEYEAQDVSAIISWLAQQPGTELEDVGQDAPPDPLIGMIGGSYGGGIQLTSAGIDKRIDAIAPGIAWNNLTTTLYPHDAFKTAFASLLLLSLVVSGSRIDTQIYEGIATGVLFGLLLPRQRDFLDDASPDNVIDDIDIPTLFLQGTVDVLFPLQQALDNYAVIGQTGKPVKTIWYCGGHGQCLDPVDADKQTAWLAQETLTWMNTYVRDKGEGSTEDLPVFQWVDQKGKLYSSDSMPVPNSALYAGSAPITASRSGNFLRLAVPVLGGSGPQNLAKFPVSLATAAPAIDAVNIAIPNPGRGDPLAETYIVGAPTVTLTYSGIGTTRTVYAQLVDKNTNRVVGNIVSPIPVTLDGQTHKYTVSMENIAYTMAEDDELVLQIVDSAAPYANFTSFGVIDIQRVDISLPTANREQVTFEDSFTAGKAPVGAGGLLGI